MFVTAICCVFGCFAAEQDVNGCYRCYLNFMLTGLIWYRRIGRDDVTEVSVNGYTQGTTKKAIHTSKARYRKILLRWVLERLGVSTYFNS